MYEEEEKTPVNNVPYPQVNRDNVDKLYAEGERIKVRCIDPQGLYYGPDFQRKREGDVFYLKPFYVTQMTKPKKKMGPEPVRVNGVIQKRIMTAKEQFSNVTMELVEEDVPEKYTKAQDALNRATDELSAGKGAGKNA